MRTTGDNAAQRMTFAGSLSHSGSTAAKRSILAELPSDLAALHEAGALHIHDLEAFGRAPNCLMIDVRKCFPQYVSSRHSPTTKILAVFDFIRNTIANLANEQSGGIGFGDFDEDLGWMLDNVGADLTDQATRDIVEASIVSLIEWLNSVRSRFGLECYYVTFNIGVAESHSGRTVAQILLDCYRGSPALFTRPNIVFKVTRKVNLDPDSPNRSLLELAMAISAERMFPTYLLCDAAPNRTIQPSRLAVMGCRTRIVQNAFGESGSIGRGNLGYVTINLPRLAANAVGAGHLDAIDRFIRGWDVVAESARRILMLRLNLLLQRSPGDFPANCEIGAWCASFDNPLSLEGVFRHGTLSLGFVGLSEAVKILGAGDLVNSTAAQSLAYDICSHMRRTVDSYRQQERLNFTLLGTSAEYCPGRFASLDRHAISLPQAEKGYYTNSFHVDVAAKLHPFTKIRLEGPFHELCNGGSVTYVELREAPTGNWTAIEDLIRAAVDANVSYLGINFPRDICCGCGDEGVFDVCPTCGGTNITRLRRVSGYIEDLSFFTSGKKAEVACRQPVDYHAPC